MSQSEWITPAEAGKSIFGNVVGKTVVRWIKSGEIPPTWPPDAPEERREEVWKISGGGRARYKLNAKVCKAIQRAWNEQARRKLDHVTF